MTIFTKAGGHCVYCENAKVLMDQAGYKYKEQVVGIHILRENFVERFPDARTYPVILDDEDNLIGGYAELREWMKTNGPKELLLG